MIATTLGSKTASHSLTAAKTAVAVWSTFLLYSVPVLAQEREEPLNGSKPALTLVDQAGHSALVSSVAFSPDGKTLANGSWDNTIKLWNVETGELVRTLTGHTDEARISLNGWKRENPKSAVADKLLASLAKQQE
jgi:WD40 repeat protein